MSSAEEAQTTAKLEPDPTNEEPSIFTQVEGDNLSPEIESEIAIPRDLDEIIPIPEDETASVVNIEDQIVAPVDVRLEHVAPVDTSSTDEPVEVIPDPSVEESPEALAPVESTTEGTGVPVELNLGQEVAVPVPSQECPVAESEQPTTHEEAPPIASNSSALPDPEVNVSIAVETEPETETLSTNFAPEEVRTLEVEEQHPLVSLGSRDAADVGSKDEVIPLAITEPGPEVVAAVVAPVLGTLELQAQHSVEEPTQMESRSVLSAEVPSTDHQLESATAAIPDASSLVDVSAEVESEQQKVSVEGYTTIAASSEPVKVQLETPSDCTAGVEHQIIPSILEDSPAHIEEEGPVLAALQVRQQLSSFYLLTVKP